jgi:hypothetical protein
LTDIKGASTKKKKKKNRRNKNESKEKELSPKIIIENDNKVRLLPFILFENSC